MWGRERWRITVPHRPSALYKRPLQVWRYLRQFPSPRSPNSSLFRQACRNSAHASLRTGRWQVSLYRRQFPSPSTSLFSQARRNCSHSPPRIRTPPGTISSDWESAETGITKRATAAAAPNAAGIIASPLPPPLGGAHLNGWTGLSPLLAPSTFRIIDPASGQIASESCIRRMETRLGGHYQTKRAPLSFLSLWRNSTRSRGPPSPVWYSVVIMRIVSRQSRYHGLPHARISAIYVVW